MKIDDGQGSGRQAGVNSRFRVKAAVAHRSEEDDQALNGNAFLLATSVITLSTANQSALLLLKNEDSRDYRVTAIDISLGTSIGGSGDSYVAYSISPGDDDGTIVSSGTAVTPINLNYASSKTSDLIAYEGDGTALTFADPMVNGQHIYEGAVNRLGVPNVAPLLPQGASIGIGVKPPAGNTSLTAHVTVYGSFLTEDF